MNKPLDPSQLELQRRALELFTSSLEQPDDARQQWLQQQCEGEPELLEKVLALHRSDLQSADWEPQLESVGSIADLVVEPLPESMNVPAADERIGQAIGAFKITEPIGFGGMSVVYKAQRTDGEFEQTVAIKLYQHSQLSKSGLQRFHLERQILARLQHPNIARLIDGGTTQDGTPYVIMEFIDGLPITQYCNQQGLNLQKRLRLLQKICLALQHAHEHHIVHRDLKPGNILVSHAGEPKLIDFGIAKQLVTESNQELPVTRLGSFLLTPEYASPEQIENKAITHATDIYALGVLFYELLTGKRPYQIDQLTPAAIEQTICHTFPADPSTVIKKSPAALPPGLAGQARIVSELRGDIDRIVMTALHKDPAQRYRSAQLLHDDIQAYLQGLPVMARGTSRWYRSKKFIARHPAGVSGISLSIILLAAGLVTTYIQNQEIKEQVERTQLTNEFLTTIISHADPTVNPETITVIDMLKAQLDDIELSFDKYPDIKVDMLQNFAVALQNYGDIKSSEEFLDQVEGSPILVKMPILHAQVLYTKAWNQYKLNQLEAAESSFQAAIELLEKHRKSNSDHQTYKKALNDYGVFLKSIYRYDDAKKYITKSIAINDIVASDDGEMASIVSTLANISTHTDTFEVAKQHFEEAFRLYEKANATESSDYANALSNYSYILSKEGEFAESLAALQKVDAIMLKTLGEKHPEYVVTLLNLATAQYKLKNYSDARDYAVQALDLILEVNSAEHVYAGYAHKKLAQIYLAMDDIVLAKEHASQAQKVFFPMADTYANDLKEIQEILNTEA